MTSANVIYYTIFLDGKKVGEYRHHLLCKPNWEKLLVFSPPENYTIQASGLDEEEEEWEGEVYKLDDFLKKVNIKKF